MQINAKLLKTQQLQFFQTWRGKAYTPTSYLKEEEEEERWPAWRNDMWRLAKQ